MSDINVLARCGSRGSPVTLAKLIRVFRANGITLEIHRRGCERPESDETNPDATNAGSSGHTRREDVVRKEGYVTCHVARVKNATNSEVEVVKYPSDEETQVAVLNVGCAVYPFNEKSERKQVDRVKKALQEVERRR